MGLMSFIKTAGEKLLGVKEAEAATAKVQAAPNDAAAKAKVAELNAAAGRAITDYIGKQGLTAKGLDVKFNGANSTVDVHGTAPDQAAKEKILLCCGNVAGVAAVNDHMQVEVAKQPESQWHEVVKGDSLSKIAKKFYGDPMKYPHDLRSQQADAERP